MTTDDERREVAERLREFTKDNQWPLTVGGNSSTIRYAISDIVFGDKKYHSGVDLLDHLADLIEPNCDREALLALAEGLEFRADELIRAAQHARFSGLGPTMDQAKHDASELRGIARCIREALGVEDG